MIFVYKTINLINGKIYVGVHEGALDDNYLGSGKAIKAAIKKYGVNNFSREIIKEFVNIEEAFEFESEIVNTDFVNDDNTYNLTLGGKGGWYYAIKRGDDNWTRRPGASEILSAAIKKSITPEIKHIRAKRMSQMRKDGTVIKPKGWCHSEESKKLMSENRKGITAWNKNMQVGNESVEVRQKKSAAAKVRAAKQDMGALGRGKKYNMRVVECPHCGKIGKGGNMSRFHFDNCKTKND